MILVVPLIGLLVGVADPPGQQPTQWPQKNDTVYVSATLVQRNPGFVTTEVPLPACIPLRVARAWPPGEAWTLRNPSVRFTNPRLIGRTWGTRFHRSPEECQAHLSANGEPRVVRDRDVHQALEPGQEIESPSPPQPTKVEQAPPPKTNEPGVPPRQIQLFRSPMVLTVALGKFRAVFDDRQTFTDMADYQCDAVSIRQVSVKARPTRSGGLMHFDADIFTERGRDKVANLLLELLLDDQVVVTKALHRLDAEEDTLRGLSTVLHLPAEAMMREAKAELRITVTVHEEP